MRRGKENHWRNTLETEGQIAVLVQDEVMTGKSLCFVYGSLSSVKSKKSSPVESYDCVAGEHQKEGFEIAAIETWEQVLSF